MRNNRTNILGKLDWSAVVIYLVMVLMGLFNIYSAAYLPDHPSLFDFAMPYGKQVMWIGVSIFLAALILLLEGNFIRKQAYIPYLVVLVLLVVVLFMPEVNGAHSWLGIGLFGVQPSEFAKFATALALARFLSTINIKIQDFRSRMYSGLLIIVPAILIYIQPDPGTMLVFVSFVLVLYREGLSGNILLFTFLAVALGLTTILMKFNEIEIPGFGIQIDGFIAIFIFFGILSLLGAFFIQQFVRKRARKRAFTLLLVGFLAISGFVFTVDSVYDKGLKDRHRNRIELYLGLKQDPDGDDYNRNRAMAAVGSGGLTGKGYKSATLANARHKHVPEQSTDFIFCTLSEEWGFLGGLSIISLFMILLVRLVVIAERQRSQFTRVYAYGVLGIFFIHFMINIGMTIGLVPVIGIPLPFFSYGGSSLMGFTILLFILLRLDAERKEVLR